MHISFISFLCSQTIPTPVNVISEQAGQLSFRTTKKAGKFLVCYGGLLMPDSPSRWVHLWQQDGRIASHGMIYIIKPTWQEDRKYLDWDLSSVPLYGSHIWKWWTGSRDWDLLPRVPGWFFPPRFGLLWDLQGFFLKNTVFPVRGISYFSRNDIILTGSMTAQSTTQKSHLNRTPHLSHDIYLAH